jgi:acyl-CoA dehydrogenase
VRYNDVRVPVTHRLGEEGSGFVIAQARLGPGRIHHCMRSIGGAERALELLCKRAASRVAFGSRLIEKQTIQNWIAESRLQIDAARLLVLHAAWKMDALGKKEARQEISMIKVVAANAYLDVLDRAIQVHGAMGVTNDTPLALMWSNARTLRIVDGPDEVHKMVLESGEFYIWPKLNAREYPCTLWMPSQRVPQKGYPLAQAHCTPFAHTPSFCVWLAPPSQQAAMAACAAHSRCADCVGSAA